MNEKYDAAYEECMGCTAERCRGAGFLDIRLANGNEAMLCSECAEAALVKAANSASSLVRSSAKRVVLKALKVLLDGVG